MCYNIFKVSDSVSGLYEGISYRVFSIVDLDTMALR